MTARRARLWLLAAAVGGWLPAVAAPFRDWFDFSAFYAAARFVFTPDVVRLEPIVLYQVDAGLPITPFVYPAAVALMYVPFTALPYAVAGFVHMSVMLGALLLATRIGARVYGIPNSWSLLGTMAWTPAAAGVISGQNTSVALLLTVLLVAALVPKEKEFDRRRQDHGGLSSWRAQIVAGAMTIPLGNKPQFVPPLWGTFLLRKQHVALLVASVGGVAVHYLLGILATGGHAAWPVDWLRTVEQYSAADFRANAWQAISLPSLFARIDLHLELDVPLFALSGFVLAGLIVARTLQALRHWDVPAAIALATAAGLVISPHAWVYHATLLLPALGVYARRAANRSWPLKDRWFLAGAYLLGATWPLGGWLGFVPLVVLVTAMPLVLLRTGGASDQSNARVLPES